MLNFSPDQWMALTRKAANLTGRGVDAASALQTISTALRSPGWLEARNILDSAAYNARRAGDQSQIILSRAADYAGQHLDATATRAA